LLDYMQAESGRPYYWQALIDDLDIIVCLLMCAVGRSTISIGV